MEPSHVLSSISVDIKLSALDTKYTCLTKVISNYDNLPSIKQELVAVVMLAALRSTASFTLNSPPTRAFMETAKSDTSIAATMACTWR